MAETDIPDPQAAPTEADEEQILQALYGPPEQDGTYRGGEEI